MQHDDAAVRLDPKRHLLAGLANRRLSHGRVVALQHRVRARPALVAFEDVETDDRLTINRRRQHDLALCRKFGAARDHDKRNVVQRLDAERVRRLVFENELVITAAPLNRLRGVGRGAKRNCLYIAGTTSLYMVRLMVNGAKTY